MRVSRNYFILMFILAGGASLWLGGQFFYNLNSYFHLTASAPATVFDWKVIEKKSGKFSIEVAYEFQVGERSVVGTYFFSKPVYQNPYLAQDLVDEWQEKSWKIWYNPKAPHEASLQKIFPMQGAVYLILSLGIILYFAFLNLYVNRMHAHEGGCRGPLS